MKKTILGRTTNLIGMASKLAGKEVSKKLKSFGVDTTKLDKLNLATRMKQAQILVDHLSQLKGAAMKAGQLISLDASEFFPKEVAEILSQLQNKVTPINPHLIEEVLNAEIKEHLPVLGINPAHPVAAASIGQVYRTQYRGNDIALKVQYPGIKESIDSDLALLEKIVSSYLAISGRKIALSDTFREVNRVLHLETDYESELKYLKRYKKIELEDSRFVVPNPIEELCTKRTLGMSWLEGRPFTEVILDDELSNTQKTTIAIALMDLYQREFLKEGLVQTDPNPEISF